MNGNDTYLNINDAHLRVTSGNVHASGFMLDQISIVTTDTTGSTIEFRNDTKAFTTRSNIEIGQANLFVDTTTSCIGINTDKPEYSLDVHGNINVDTLSFLTLSGDATTLTGVARSEDLLDNSSRITSVETSTTNHSSLLSGLRTDVDMNYALSVALASANTTQDELLTDLTTNLLDNSSRMDTVRIDLNSNVDKISHITSTTSNTLISSNLEISGTLSATGPSGGALHDKSSILYMLSTTFYKEWEYTNYVSPSVKVTFNSVTEIPNGATAILADVYLSRDNLTTNGDHQVHILGKNHTSGTNWNSGYTSNAPSTYFGSSIGSRQVASIMMPGGSDGFTHHNGIWHTSVIIPLENNQIYYSNYGNDSSSGWVYIHIRGYYI